MENDHTHFHCLNEVRIKFGFYRRSSHLKKKTNLTFVVVNDVTVNVLVCLQRKFDNRDYHTANEFAEDVRLVFTNCYRYNAVESDVVMMARKLQVSHSNLDNL